MDNSPRKWWVLFATGLSGILIAIDYSIVNTSLANIQRELQASVNQLQWIMTGFGITFCTFLVIMGRLGDLLGRRKLLYIGIIGFGFSSIVAGAAIASWQLIAARILQGVFGATLFPCGMALTAAAFPANEQGRALGVYGSLLGSGLAFGPVLGGIITYFFSWRWIFFINIPVVLVSLLLCFLFVAESRLKEKIKLDWWGLFLLTACLVMLVLAISQGLEWGWSSLPILSLFVGSAVLLVIFIIVENKTAMPLIPFHYMQSPQFFIGNLIFIAGASFNWPVIFLVPLYLQSVLNYSSLATGLLLLPMTAMIALVPGLAGHWLDKKGITAVTYGQFSVSILAFILLMTLQASSSIGWMIAVFVVAGLGWGICNGVGMPIALSGLKNPDHAGLLSGATTTILNIVGVLMLAVSTAIFRFGESSALAVGLQHNNIILSSSQLSAIKAFLSDPEQATILLAQFGQQTANQIVALFRQAFMHGFRIAIFMLFIALLFGFGSVIVALRRASR